MPQRSGELAQRVSYLYACALLTVHYLFLPFGGYERMMEGKYVCFLVLTGGYVAAMCFVSPFKKPRFDAVRLCAALYIGFSAVSALLSPYGVHTLLGGSRREGLITLTLYAAAFFLLSGSLHTDRRLLCIAALAVSLCDVLALAQTAGANVFGLYPAGLGYYDGDLAYAGFFAGTSGNIDFTAFLLALALCVMLAAAVRLGCWVLVLPAALTFFVLLRLDVSGSLFGAAFAAVWSPALLVKAHRRQMLFFSAALSIFALLFALLYKGDSGAVSEAARFLRGEAEGSFGSGRIALWRNCLPLVRERPLFGGGPDTLWLRGVEPFTWMKNGEAVPSDVTAAHNEYLNILVNQGAAALAAYAAMLGCALARCFRRAEDARFAVCGAGLLCYTAMAFFSISTCITAPYIWFLLAVVQKDEITVENHRSL
ncbi:MAG: O-antigen ligase family protein [Oscillospiraceae bacterium]|nr:O-antigen ligase family protein [Oscillospiraceae bacterium]